MRIATSFGLGDFGGLVTPRQCVHLCAFADHRHDVTMIEVVFRNGTLTPLSPVVLFIRPEKSSKEIQIILVIIIITVEPR